jgi:hypothetical protein
VRYDTSYVIVAGVAWIRRSRVETQNGRVDDSVWVVLFDGEQPVARKGAAGDSTIERGELDGISWDLRWTALAASFETPGNALLRRVAPTHLVTTPALSISGRIGDRLLDEAPGHTARLWGKRHAQTWGWAHASTADGRWAHLLTARAPPLPRVAQHATERSGPGLPLARSRVEPPQMTVGPYVVDAPVETFIGLRYLDTDGSEIWCYHSERGHLRGAGVDLQGAAMEIAVRAPMPGWRVEA